MKRDATAEGSLTTESGRLARDLAQTVGRSHVIADADLTAGFRIDWTGRFGADAASPIVVVRPASTAQVAAVLGVARANRTPVVTQGGNTGLVGGSVPSAASDSGRPTIVLSTTRLTAIDDPDVVRGHVTVGAGVTLAALAERLSGTGWRFAVDLGARDSATVGGMVATNAGGMRVFRFGSMRAQILGLEFVTADGRVIDHLGSVEKDNTGYDLAGLLCGSEGTLAVVTAARLRLIPDPAERATAMLGFATAASARDAGWTLRRHAGEVEVVEYVDGACLDLVARVTGGAPPITAPHALLVEAAGGLDVGDHLAARVSDLAVAPTAAAVAVDERTRAALWRFRDEITPSLASIGPVRKFDVSIPSSFVDSFRADVESIVATLDLDEARCWWFGHVCDDNLHLNLTGIGDDSATVAAADLDERILASVVDHHGSISAEHGIGRAKAPYLRLARSTDEIALMRALKAAFDPAGLLNPGVLLAPGDADGATAS